MVTTYSIRLQKVLDIIENEKPKEGRDYIIHITYSGSNIEISLIGLTTIGHIFADKCNTILKLINSEITDEYTEQVERNQDGYNQHNEEQYVL